MQPQTNIVPNICPYSQSAIPLLYFSFLHIIFNDRPFLGSNYSEQLFVYYVVEVLKVLVEVIPDLLMTTDSSNTTALHTAALQGHIEVVNFLLEKGSSVATIAKRNGKTALHSAARNGHLEIVKALLIKEPRIATSNDKKGQTALHMAVKGLNVELVDELMKSDPSLINIVDTKGNTALHVATRKGRAQVMKVTSFKISSTISFLFNLPHQMMNV